MRLGPEAESWTGFLREGIDLGHPVPSAFPLPPLRISHLSHVDGFCQTWLHDENLSLGPDWRGSFVPETLDGRQS